MDSFFISIKNSTTVNNAILRLQDSVEITPQIQKAIDFCIKLHQGQKRKSGEPYAVHPILVAAITAKFSKDSSMVISALLHDVVEDTPCTIKEVENEYGSDVAYIVDGLTKIVEIREHELIKSDSNEKLLSSALTFRKMLVASIDDVRVLVIKLCDRLHNMLTLDALKPEKRLRIAEETLVVYAPIAHRLGISTIKNELEDLSFSYIYPNDFAKIHAFLVSHEYQIQLTLNKFIANVTELLFQNGFSENEFKINSRIKHKYSTFLKMHRKGISIEEVLDLFALRIIVENDVDCYKVLGVIHLHFKPLIARFKDYIAIPKENGYRTIHTTVFHQSKIYEVQIRTKQMHEVAEYGIAAHWIYKSGVKTSPNLDWLKSLAYSNENENIEEFYSYAKEALFSEDIVVYSPKGDVFNLPRGSTALDYAYAVHSDVGSMALESYVNNIKKPLLSELKSGDIVSIKTSKEPIARCSWVDMVKTSRAKKSIKVACATKIREIDEFVGKNIINTIYSRYKPNITDEIKSQQYHRIPDNLDYLKHVKRNTEKMIIDTKGFMARLRVQNLHLREYKFDNIAVYSNFSINSVLFDHCCHPKFGDDIVAFKENNNAVIHHKMCDNAFLQLSNGHKMLFCCWAYDSLYRYRMVVSLPNVVGTLAKLLTFMSGAEMNIVFIEYGKDKSQNVQYVEIEFEISNENKDDVRKALEQKVKIVEFAAKKDAYK